MNTHLSPWALVAALLLAWPAAAQQAPTVTPTPRAAVSAPAGLYQALGEKPGIARLMDDFVDSEGNKVGLHSMQ